MKFDHQ